MNTFWVLWIFNIVMALIPIYFFFVGLNDGSVNGRNIGLWMIILLLIGGILLGTQMLKNSGKLSLANGILVAASIPGVVVILFALVIMIGKPRWN